MRIAVIDGQGGGIGKYITEKIRKELGKEIEIIALGTNSLATAQMLKAGANDGATGENAVVHNVNRVDLVVGSIAIVLAHSMLGEMTPLMAEAVAGSQAPKFLLPINRCRVEIIGVQNEPLPHQVDALIQQIKEFMEEGHHVRG